jgi:hypothetical protein
MRGMKQEQLCEINGALVVGKWCVANAPYKNMKDGGLGGMNGGEINGAPAPPGCERFRILFQWIDGGSSTHQNWNPTDWVE